MPVAFNADILRGTLSIVGNNNKKRLSLIFHLDSQQRAELYSIQEKTLEAVEVKNVLYVFFCVPNSAHTVWYKWHKWDQFKLGSVFFFQDLYIYIGTVFRLVQHQDTAMWNLQGPIFLSSHLRSA